MNSAIANVLNKVLGDFVEDFNPEQLNISLFSGKLKLERMKIKPQALEQFGLPVVLKYGVISGIEATIPWTSLSSSPLKVEVTGVYLLFHPKTPDQWSHEAVARSLLANKYSHLDRFEFLNSEQLAATQAPGFVEKLVTKIIDNLQITLTNVYIRLEDFSSSSEPFAMGLIVKSAEAATCNEQWTREFVVDSPRTYKSVELQGLALYMDYGPGCEVDSSKIPGKTPEKSFENLSRQESGLRFLIKHRFILSACGCVWHLTLNKDSKDLSRPQVAVQMVLGSEEGIKCGTELKQVTHAVKLLEFCGKFDTFAKGVAANCVLRDFTDAEGEEYRHNYIQWQLKPAAERGEEETVLKDAEKEYLLDAIVKQRVAAKAELKLLVQEEEAKRTLSEVSTVQSSGGFRSFFSFGKSKAAQEEADRKQRIEAAELEIQKAREARERFREELSSFLASAPSFSDLPSTYERFLVRVDLNSTRWTLINEDRELLSSVLGESSVDVIIRVSGMKVAINSPAFSLIDGIEPSELYPRFLEMHGFALQYVDFPEVGKNLEVVTGNSFCTLNFSSIFQLIAEVKRVIVAEVDVDYYRELLEGKVRDLLQKGKEYMKKLAREGVAPQSLQLSVSCKAPCFMIPFDMSQKRALIADFGQLTLKTQSATRDWELFETQKRKDSVYDCYHFKAADFVLATLWDFSEARKWQEGQVETIVTPSPFILQVCSAVFPQVSPANEVTAEMESLQARFSDQQFQFIMQLQDRILSLKDRYMPPTDSLEEKAPEKETTMLTDQMKTNLQVQSQRVTLEVRTVSLDLFRGDQCIAQYSLSAFSSELNLFPSAQVKLNLRMLRIAARDPRPDQMYPMIVSMQASSESPVVDVTLDLNPLEDKIEVTAQLRLLSVLLNPEFLFNTLRFFTESDQSLHRAQSQQSVRRTFTALPSPVSRSKLLKKLMSVNVFCSDFNLVVPESVTSKRLSHLGFNCAAEYKNTMEYYDLWDDKGGIVGREVESSEDSVGAQVKDLEVSIGTLQAVGDLHSFIATKPGILKASKAEAKMRKVARATDSDAVINLDIRQFGLFMGFADIRSLLSTKDYCLAGFTQTPKEAPEHRDAEAGPSRVNYSLSVFSDEVVATVFDDTVAAPQPLVRLRFPTVSLSLKYSEVAVHCDFALSLALEYHNGAACVYEPLIENWSIELSADQQPSSSLEVEAVSRTPLAVNISYAAMVVLSRVLQKLQQGIASWVPPLVEAQAANAVLQYKIKNKLGVPVSLWVEDSTFALVLGDGESSIVSEEAWRVEREGAGRAANPVHAMSMQVEPYGAAKGLILDDVGLTGHRLLQGSESKVVVCRVQSKSKYRVVTLEGDMKVCNNALAPLAVRWKEEERTVRPGCYESIPITWQFPEILLLAPSSPINFRLCSQFRIDQSTLAVLDRVSIKCSGEIQTVYFINPPMTIQNMLPGAVTATFRSQTCTIPAGGECQVFTESSTAETHCAVDVSLGWGKVLKAADIAIAPGKRICRLAGERTAFEVEVLCEVNEYMQCGKVDLRGEKAKKVDFSGKLVTLQAGVWLINHTNYHLTCADESGNEVRIPPSNFSVCSFSSSLRVRMSDVSGAWSKQFSADTAGLAGSLTLQTASRALVSLGVWVENATWPLPKSKVLHFYPRFVVKNSLPYAVFLKPQKAKRSIAKLESQQSMDFQFPDDHSFLQVSMDEQNWSGAFNIEDISSFQIHFPALSGGLSETNPWWMPNPTLGPMCCAQVAVTSENQAMITTYLTVPESPDFLIRNESDTYVSATQQDCRDRIVVKPGTSVPFIFDDHVTGKRKVRVVMGKKEQMYNIEKVGKSKRALGGFNVEKYVHSASRVLHIYRERDRASLSQKSTSRFATWKVSVQLSALSVALVNEEPREILLLSLPTVRASLDSSDSVIQDSTRTEQYLNVTVPTIQIDNMCAKPQEFEVILSQVLLQDEEPTPLLQLELKRSVDHKADDPFECFEYIRLSLQEVQVNIHQATVMRLATVLQKVLSPFDSQLQPKPFPLTATFTDICPGLTPAGVEAFSAPKPQRKSYFQLIVIYGTIINLSIKTSPHKVNAMLSNSFGLLRGLQRVGAALINISNSRLKFTTVMLKDSFTSTNEVSSKIVQNYARQGMWQVYRLVGSSDMLGNPIGLINKLGSGVFELFNEPRKGLLQGPQEFATGVRRGVKSFVSNVVSGGMGSVSKITGSFYGLLREAQGDEDAYERINRPDSASSGVLEGLKGGFTDLAEGVTGIFTKPVAGIKKGGFTGFLKGVKSGIVGAVTAPVSAVLRTGTTITSGMASSASKLSSVLPPKRVRHPRQTNARKVLEPYNETKAEIQVLFHEIKQFQKEKVLYCARCRTGIVVLTPRYLAQVVSTSEFSSVGLDKVSQAKLSFNVETTLQVTEVSGGRIDIMGRREVVLEIHAAVHSLAKSLDS